MTLNVGYTATARSQENSENWTRTGSEFAFVGLLHLIDAYAELNANETVIETSNCIDNAA